MVIRRVGGLEAPATDDSDATAVIRRVGGLEGDAGPLQLSGELSAV